MSDELEPLHPINPDLLPFRVGEKVAFREDHDEHGGSSDPEDPRPAKYGLVQAVGVDADGEAAFDLLVFDPTDGITGEETTVYRARMGDIQ